MDLTSLPVRIARRHLFLILFGLALALELLFARSTDWDAGGFEEKVILFDLCLFLPALHVAFYRRRLPLRTLVVRTVGLSLLGFYIASCLVPAEAQQLIADWSGARSAGLVVLALIELRLMIEVMKIVWGGKPSADEVAAKLGAPAWTARLMIAEVNFWKWVWRRIRGR